MTSTTTSRCHVQGCRFSWSHVTAVHKCGKCGLEGHGILECNRPSRIRALGAHLADLMDEPCAIAGCDRPFTHHISAHQCSICNGLGHECRPCPECRTVGKINLEASLYTGSDCSICYETKPMVVFESCRHARVCKECALQLQ